MAETVIKCLFCNASSKYSCPQCSIRYCSVKCYQHEEHQTCSESFYKEQVMKELKGMKGSSEEKRKMLQTLSQLNNTEHTVEKIAAENNISTRLNDISLDDYDAIWSQLTDHEKNTFQKRIQSGNLDFIDVWEPWWIHKGNSKVVEIESAKKSDTKSMPKILRDIPPITDVLKTKTPDERLKYSIIEIIFLYSLTKRLFNGDLYDTAEETVDFILSNSKVLTENRIYLDLDTCIHCLIQNVNMDKDVSIDPLETSLNDLMQILTSPYQATLRALSDLHTFLRRYQKFLKRTMKDDASTAILQKVTKKLYFFIVYVSNCSIDVDSIVLNVQVIRDRLLEERKTVEYEKKDIEANLKNLRRSGNPLIVDLSNQS